MLSMGWRCLKLSTVVFSPLNFALDYSPPYPYSSFFLELQFTSKFFSLAIRVFSMHHVDSGFVFVKNVPECSKHAKWSIWSMGCRNVTKAS